MSDLNSCFGCFCPKNLGVSVRARSHVIGRKQTRFNSKTGLREKQLLQDQGYVEDVGDALLHAAWSVQDIRIIL